MNDYNETIKTTLFFFVCLSVCEFFYTDKKSLLLLKEQTSESAVNTVCGHAASPRLTSSWYLKKIEMSAVVK